VTNEADNSSRAETDQAPARWSLAGHLRIARVDHWIKNVFILPGVVVALSMEPFAHGSRLILPLLLGLFSGCLIASSNYTLNEILDAPFDRLHPTKCRRPVPSGQVNIPLGYAQWLVLMAAGAALAWAVSAPFLVTMAALWLMGIVYNVRPLRTKDLPFLDVVSEAVNNPLRFLAGWFIVSPVAVPPLSLLISYWMVGCYFMAIKRFAEYRDIKDPERAAAYRKSFRFYNEQRLIVSIMFYASIAMLFFGAFIVRYRLELILSFPFIAAVMAVYFSVGFKEGSATQAPEKLHREPLLLAAIISCVVLIAVLFFVDIPILYKLFPAEVRTW
jgi:decaprenyl-phosphate phosphoribosyltransferase